MNRTELIGHLQSKYAYGITPNLFDENPHLTYKDVILQKFLFADETPFGIKE